MAARANVDTFVYPNAAPQAARFNQSKVLWNGLEDYVLEYARAQPRRLSVLTGPVLAQDNPVYRGVQLPRRFWKIAAWAAAAGRAEDPTASEAEGPVVLAATGYLLDQSPQLRDLDRQLVGARCRAGCRRSGRSGPSRSRSPSWSA